MKNRYYAIVLLALAADTARAHTGAAEVEGLASGFIHPFLGLDHLLVMSGLGLWLSRHPARHRLIGLIGFVAFMALGAWLAIAGHVYNYVETLVLLSLVMTGILLISRSAEIAQALSSALIVLIALMHGQAHGAEVPPAAPAGLYVAGFVSGTAALLASGVVCGSLLDRFRAQRLARVYGGVVGLAGVWLLSTL